ncbi:hypothetical protein SASPL_119815 [Salvia splendens]|uniref:Uncharacterized protein n=1 Tax=Salvia splendens TaxID=180675 RepID=A0A8X8XU93_SALSN|nr:hypothetical protein SASPL_119815 [Salvia splendens]
MISVLAQERLLGAALGSLLTGSVVFQQRRSIYKSINQYEPQEVGTGESKSKSKIRGSSYLLEENLSFVVVLLVLEIVLPVIMHTVLVKQATSFLQKIKMEYQGCEKLHHLENKTNKWLLEWFYRFVTLTCVSSEFQPTEPIFGQKSRQEFAHMWNKSVDNTFGPMIEYLSSRGW